MACFLKAFVPLAMVSTMALTPALAEPVSFAAGPAYGGADLKLPGSGEFSGIVYCRIYNNGTTAKLTKRRIYADNGEAIEHVSSCKGTMKPRTYCSYGQNFTGNRAFTCTITVEATTASITGVAEIRDSQGKVLVVVPFSR